MIWGWVILFVQFWKTKSLIVLLNKNMIFYMSKPLYEVFWGLILFFPVLKTMELVFLTRDIWDCSVDENFSFFEVTAWLYRFRFVAILGVEVFEVFFVHIFFSPAFKKTKFVFVDNWDWISYFDLAVKLSGFWIIVRLTFFDVWIFGAGQNFTAINGLWRLKPVLIQIIISFLQCYLGKNLELNHLTFED